MLETSRFNWQGWEADTETASGQDAGSASYLNQAWYSSFSFLTLLWHRSGKIKPSPTRSRLLGGGEHPDCWICRQGFSSAHTASPREQFLCYSKCHCTLQLTTLRSLPPSSTFTARTTCALFLPFFITLYPIRNIYVNLGTSALPCSHDYLDQMCSNSLRDLTSSAHLCKIFRTHSLSYEIFFPRMHQKPN